MKKNSEVGRCSFTDAKKKYFYHRFLTQYNVVPKKEKKLYHDKQLTPTESWNQDVFFSLGLWCHQIQIMWLECKQCCGSQIMVNT